MKKDICLLEMSKRMQIFVLPRLNLRICFQSVGKKIRQLFLDAKQMDQDVCTARLTLLGIFFTQVSQVAIMVESRLSRQFQNLEYQGKKVIIFFVFRVLPYRQIIVGIVKLSAKLPSKARIAVQTSSLSCKGRMIYFK